MVPPHGEHFVVQAGGEVVHLAHVGRIGGIQERAKMQLPMPRVAEQRGRHRVLLERVLQPS